VKAELDITQSLEGWETADQSRTSQKSDVPVYV
jgi:hypothetical protein